MNRKKGPENMELFSGPFLYPNKIELMGPSTFNTNFCR